MADPVRFLIHAGGADAMRLATGGLSLAGARLQIERLFKDRPEGFGLVNEDWFLAAAEQVDDRPWDTAHSMVVDGLGLGLAPGFSYVEPDLLQEWTWQPPQETTPFAAADPCAYEPKDPLWPWPEGGSFTWFLDDAFTGLRSARSSVDHSGIRIAHLDTGYGDHATTPLHLNLALARNFVEENNDARESGLGGPGKNPGHGTATLAILAGKTLATLSEAHQNTNEPLGGAPDAEIVPVRIADGVVHFYTSAMARGLDHATNTGCHVVSISMGGIPSRAWADAVNRAYENGVCIVAAAGNHMVREVAGKVLRSPTFIVYPARFRRVIAACGVNADGSPYYRPDDATREQQGNFGPRSKMQTALAAYTPNVPWARLGCPQLIGERGSGTSSATPQVAAAAALWLAKRNPQYDEPWKRVEAVRAALFATAEKKLEGREEYFGNGAVRAREALDFPPPAPLQQTPPDSVFLPILRVLTGIGVAPAQVEMLHVEVSQLLQRSEALAGVLQDPDVPVTDDAQIKRFLEALSAEPECSNTLRRYVEGEYLQRYRSFPSAAPRPTDPAVVPAKQRPRAPEIRRLRGYAFDPSLSGSLDTAAVNQMTFGVRWEKSLGPGPVGEYLEVIDYDGGTHRLLEPVNLNDPYLLARDGLDPSEGDRQFHQQMVYAVGMTAIQHFERALGRPVLWAPQARSGRPPYDDSVFVPRLRVYPHAIKQQNAYYSPAKRALLFGYFPASSADPGRQYPGGVTFTCLSHDIVAHETTHAVLDGMHRRLSDPTNPDMLAFHEAFADVVALFQHFTFPEVVRHQIARTRNDLSGAQLLTDLALQFGEATGMRGALRSAVGGKPDPSAYQTVMEPHQRGSLLVATVFDAFLAIYNLRTADLMRIASDGSGLIRPGQLPQDLVNRLAEEAARAARQVLDICIRALDYCPPADLTFGDYLRALVTADYDLVPEDSMGYRLAFLEAFRKRGLYPLDVETLSVDSLRWRSPDGPAGASAAVTKLVQDLREYAEKCSYLDSRRRLFELTHRTRGALHGSITQMLRQDPAREEIAKMLGLDLPDTGPTLEVHALRVAQRVKPNLTAQAHAIIELTQSRRLPVDESTPTRGSFLFTSGSTLVVDLVRSSLQYVVVKNAHAPRRIERTREYLKERARAGGLALYAQDEPFALLHSAVAARSG